LVLVLLVRQIYQISRFEKWLSAGGKGPLPKATGVWGEIYHHLQRLRKNEKRRKKS